jgi:hypothetical protein
MAAQSTLSFKLAFERLAPVFVVFTACMYVYAWVKHPDIIKFLTHLFFYQLPLLVAHAYMAFIATLEYPGCVTGGTDDSESPFDWEDEVWINPGTGAQMIGGVGGIDTMGYGFGSGPGD